MTKDSKEKVYFRFLYPSELLVLLTSALTVVLYMAFELSLKNPIGFYVQQLKMLPLAYPFGLFISFICLLGIDGYRCKKSGEKSSEKEVWQRFCGSYLTFSQIVKDLRLLNVVMITFVLFMHLKNLIPVINPSVWDQSLLDFEKMLFGGRVAFEVFDLFVPRSWAFTISSWYKAYYVYFSLALFIFVLQRKDSKLAEEFCFSFCFIWILGVMLTYLLPTWGPCFFVPEIYESLPDTDMRFMQADLWQMKAVLEVDRNSPGDTFGISGLPSMHFAVVLLGSVYLMRLSRILSVVSWLFVGATFVSTLYFGWHYLLDDIASIVLVAGVVWMVGSYYRLLDEQA